MSFRASIDAVTRVQGISDQQQFVQTINAFNAPLSWLRLLKYMEAISPKTRQVAARVPLSIELLKYMMLTSQNFLYYVLDANFCALLTFNSRPMGPTDMTIFNFYRSTSSDAFPMSLSLLYHAADGDHQHGWL
jgi:hypothetical protein